MNKKDYSIGAGAWIGDYIDPNTFLGMFVSGGNRQSDELEQQRLRPADRRRAKEQDDQKRLQEFSRRRTDSHG